MVAVAFALGLGLGFNLRGGTAPAPLAAPNPNPGSGAAAHRGTDAPATTSALHRGTDAPATTSAPPPLPPLPAGLCAARAKLRLIATKEDFVQLLDAASAAYQLAVRPFRFIEVGANDGVGFSDRVMDYVERFAWTGVLLEPAPVHFRALRKAYAKLVAKGRQLVFLNRAVSADGAPLVIYSAGPLHLLPKWAMGVFSTDRAHVQSHLDTYLRKLPAAKAAQLRKGVSITGERVEATTFAQIRREHRVPANVEYLQVVRR
jgi:hypothetical protein